MRVCGCVSLSLSLARSTCLYLKTWPLYLTVSSLSALPVGHDRATKGAGCWEAQHWRPRRPGFAAFVPRPLLRAQPAWACRDDGNSGHWRRRSHGSGGFVNPSGIRSCSDNHTPPIFWCCIPPIYGRGLLTLLLNPKRAIEGDWKILFDTIGHSLTGVSLPITCSCKPMCFVGCAQGCQTFKRLPCVAQCAFLPFISTSIIFFPSIFESWLPSWLPSVSVGLKSPSWKPFWVTNCHYPGAQLRTNSSMWKIQHL